MRIQVSGRHIDVGEALQARVAAGIEELAAKYAGRPTEATVTFSRDAHLMCCEVVVRLSTGLTAQARAAAGDAPSAFEAAREKMATQLRRHKRRLKDHHHGRTEPVATVPAGSYVLAPFADDPDDEVPVPEEVADGPDAPDAPDGADGAAGGPAIIAEAETALPSLSVGEAVMQMELAHASVLVFRHERRGGVQVVYRREDGNVGWIDAGEGRDAPVPAGPAARG